MSLRRPYTHPIVAEKPLCSSGYLKGELLKSHLVLCDKGTELAMSSIYFVNRCSKLLCYDTEYLFFNLKYQKLKRKDTIQNKRKKNKD